MAARWTEKEHSVLTSLLEDGVRVQTLCEAIPTRTEAAIVTRARNKKFGLNYRTSGKDRKLYKGVSRRYQRTDDKGIKDKARAVGAAQMPNTSERTTERFSDVIVADSAYNINSGVLKHIYEDVTKLLHSEHYQQIASIAVTLENTVLTVTKGSS